MALTRAQYLAPGGSSPALAGQVQGVKQGTGITIALDGTISFNAATATGVVTAVNAGTGLSGGGSSGSVTLTNTGVTSLIAGSNITLSGSTGDVTITSSPLATYFPTQRSLVTTQVTTGGEQGQGAQTLDFGSQSFSIPSTANAIIIQTRMSALTFANGSSALAGGSIYTEDCQFNISFGGVVSGLGTAVSSNLAVFSATGIGRSQGQFLVRNDLFNTNTTSGGTLTMSVTVGQTSSIQANCLFSNLITLVTPIKQ